jgi:hypothetical protein
MSGGDWADASVEHLSIPENIRMLVNRMMRENKAAVKYLP